eukprot:TRINITY_DN18587_c0_g1_i1.p2 TRINITY_DN18587_c0_g1~~TRINITY_DN18587_c0_g1_i1.p2  ORF type:complete len:262 (-),score=60.74 TRINITY_DN18587_c0_g1_i1:64-849(-)
MAAYNQGAGYMDSPSAGGVDSPHKTRVAGAASTPLVPATIKQLQTATQAHDDVFRVDERDIAMVTLVGVIESANEQSASATYMLNDSTGSIEVRIWLDGDESPEAASRRREVNRAGAYVRVAGHLRSFMGKRSVVACSVQPLTDYNELTYHLLEVVYVHLHALHQYGGQPGAQYGQQIGVPARWQEGQPVTADHTALILQILAHGNSQQNGTSFDELMSQLAEYGGLPSEEVRSNLQSLIVEGGVYTTCDDNHFKGAQSAQ